MGIKERESVIQELALVTGYNTSVFEKLTDEELEKEMKRVYD